MFLSQLRLLFGFALTLSLLVGCGGSNTGSAERAADQDELAQYLADHPDQNVDGMEELDEEGDFDE